MKELSKDTYGWGFYTVISLAYPRYYNTHAPSGLKWAANFDPLAEHHLNYYSDKLDYKYQIWQENNNKGKTREECDKAAELAELHFKEIYRSEFAKGEPVEKLKSLHEKGFLTCKQLHWLLPLCNEMQVVWEKLTHKLLAYYPDDFLIEKYMVEYTAGGEYSDEYGQPIPYPILFDETYDTKVGREFLESVIRLLRSETCNYLNRWRISVFNIFEEDIEKENSIFVRDYLFNFFAPVDHAYIKSRSDYMDFFANHLITEIKHNEKASEQFY